MFSFAGTDPECTCRRRDTIGPLPPPGRLDRWLLNLLKRACGNPDVEIGLRDTPPPPPGSDELPMLRFTSRKSIQHLLLKPELRFGKSHAAGDFGLNDVPPSTSGNRLISGFLDHAFSGKRMKEAGA